MLSDELTDADLDCCITSIARLMQSPLEYGTLPASYKQINLHHGEGGRRLDIWVF